MPPDADTIRQRRNNAGGKENAEDDLLTPTVAAATTGLGNGEIRKSVEKLDGKEVCIDGVIYTLEGFDHPGGDSIFLFGGNDVTIQYKMIHPYHTAHHLNKLKRVGVATDYKAEYVFDTEFEREIKAEVFKIVPRGKEFGTPGFFFRAVVCLVFFLYLQYLWVTQCSSWQLAVIYGVSQALIGLNVQHDANHGACSKKYTIINDMLGIGADLIGGSKWLWMEQHWTHHAYTNHARKDPDAFGAEPMMLFNEYPIGHPARTWVHQFQAFYFVLVLAGYWISAVFNPQIWDLRHRGAKSAGMKMDNDYVVSRRKYAWALRIIYVYLNVVSPFAIHGLCWKAFGLMMLMGASGSLALAVLFSLSHTFESTERDSTGIVKNDGKPACWFKSQVETSCTYGGLISGWLTGGLNFQIEHHLFPRMSSAWYPFIAPAVRCVCAKHGVRYVYYPWIWQNVISTLKYVHATGTGAKWKNQNPYSGKL